MTQNNEQKILRVLAIDPNHKGFGYAILEAPNELIDWGTKKTGRNKNENALLQIQELIERYQPSIMLVEDTARPGSHRRGRIRELIARMIVLAASEGVRSCKISRKMVQKVFSVFGCSTKQEIAQTIARYLSELARSLPACRKAWMSEDSRMSIFDAVAMALTYFHFRGTQ